MQNLKKKVIKAVSLKGCSMRPFLKDGDVALVREDISSVKKGDIVLYEYSGASYVHRVKEKVEAGFIIFNDDDLPDHFVPAKDIKGIVETSFFIRKFGFFISRAMRLARKCLFQKN